MTTHDFTTIATAQILDSLCEVVDQARASGNLTPSWARALDTAYDYLLTTDAVAFDALAHALRVESATEPGTFYTANGDCQCKAFTQGAGVCWHRAAARLVRRALASNAEYQRATALRIAASIAATRKQVSDARWAATENLMAEMFA